MNPPTQIILTLETSPHHVTGEVVEANDKAIAFRVVEPKSQAGEIQVIEGPSLTLLLAACGYSHEPGTFAGVRHVFVTSSITYAKREYVLRNKRAHEVWAWLKNGHCPRGES